ncbi:MAG: insulinase family protein [Bauldia sp.]|nr:insulinase family protein [Bauldia sp.]
MTVEISRLPSGLTIVTQRMEHLQSASLGVWVGAGSRAETEAEHGIAHLLEHMAFKGTKRRNAIAIAEEIEAVGGELNASTSVEMTNYYARVLKDDLPLAMDILSDIMVNSVIDEEELSRERHVVVQEIGAALDTPEDLVYDFFSEAAFPGQPLGRPILGTEASVRAMSRPAILNYLGKHYHGPSMVVAAAGAVDHAEVRALAEAGLGALPPEAAVRPAASFYRGGDRRETRDLMEAQILLGFAGRSFASPDYYAAQILSTALGGGMSSRLFQEVREKRGLCYSIYAFHWAFTDGGIFGIHAATGEDDVTQLMPVVLGEVERIAHDLTEAELNRAKAQLKAGLLMALESPVARAGQMARQILIHGRTLDASEIVAKIDAVGVDTVRRLAGTMFTATTPTLAAIGPVKGLIRHDDLSRRLGAPAAAA